MICTLHQLLFRWSK